LTCTVRSVAYALHTLYTRSTLPLLVTTSTYLNGGRGGWRDGGCLRHTLLLLILVHWRSGRLGGLVRIGGGSTDGGGTVGSEPLVALDVSQLHVSRGVVLVMGVGIGVCIGVGVTVGVGVGVGVGYGYMPKCNLSSKTIDFLEDDAQELWPQQIATERK